MYLSKFFSVSTWLSSCLYSNSVRMGEKYRLLKRRTMWFLFSPTQLISCKYFLYILYRIRDLFFIQKCCVTNFTSTYVRFCIFGSARYSFITKIFILGTFKFYFPHSHVQPLRIYLWILHASKPLNSRMRVSKLETAISRCIPGLLNVSTVVMGQSIDNIVCSKKWKNKVKLQGGKRNNSENKKPSYNWNSTVFSAYGPYNVFNFFNFFVGDSKLL